MYAVIKTGGKQYQVREGQRIRLEKLDAELGAEVEFNEVLMVVNGEEIVVGSPMVEGALVKAEVVTIGRGKKINIIKMKRRKHHRKHMGHRQWYTQVKITGIQASV